MRRFVSMFAFPFVCALWLAAPLLAQSSSAYTVPLTPGTLYAPEIHLGSATEPSTITAPPIEEIPATPTQPYVSNAPPASTELLATRHFDFVTSPEKVVPGSMEDTSISLGEYARQLRAEKQMQRTPSATPNAIASPNWK
jgi:hypothetical protein